MKVPVIICCLWFSFSLWGSTTGLLGKMPPPEYDVSNDTMFFDLNNAVFSGAGPYFIDIPMFIRSNGPISNFDFWFQFNQSEMTYDSTINMVSSLDPFTYYNPFNQFLSNTTSGPIATYTVPMNTTLLYVRFELSGPCTLVDASDFNTITTLLNGSECQYMFIDIGGETSLLGISSDVLCDGNATNFSGPDDINGNPVVNWSWDFGNGITASTQDTALMFSSGQFPVSLSVTTEAGCLYSFTQNIDVGAIPSASFTFTITSDQDSVLFTNTSDSAQYSWNFGDGALSNLTDPIHLYNGGGFFEVTLTAANQGCSSIYVDTVLVDLPTAVFTYSGNCSGSVISFDSQSSYVNGTITSYQWNFDNGTGSTFEDPVTSYGIAGEYVVSLTVTGSNGSQHTFSDTIVIDNKPIVLFTANPQNACSPLSTSFTNNSITDPGSVYYWNFGDNTFSLLQSPSKVYPNAGVYTIQLTISSPNGCVDSLIIPNYISVLESPNLDFQYSPACTNSFINFSEIVQSGAVPSVSWAWNFGDGGTSSLANPSYFYPSEGNFNVTLNVTNDVGCPDDTTITVFVRNKPIPNFSTVDTIGCAPLNVTFSNSSITAPSSIYQWDFGNGIQSALVSPSQIYGLSGMYSVSLVVYAPGGCADTLVQDNLIQVQSGVVANFQVDQHCVGELTQFTDLSVSTSGSLSSWAWNFGNGFTANVQNPQVVFANPGIFSVLFSVVTDQGCSDTVTIPIAMDIKPLVDFSIPTGFGCPPFEVTFTNETTQNSGSSYSWTFGDGSNTNIASPIHIYDSMGVFTVALVVTSPNGCSDSLIQSDLIQLQTPPEANFTFLYDTLFIPEAQLSVQNNSLNATSFSWTFGDGYSSALPEPSHIFADSGLFAVCLSAFSEFGCEAILCDSIIVIESSILAIPTAFTPNGDGANDVFLVRGGPFKIFQMRIFNEWGNLLFNTSDPLIGWNGTYSGLPQPSGAYEYVVTGETLTGNEINQYGVINLQRN
jgi:gliding motility-associated-like protein